MKFKAKKVTVPYLKRLERLSERLLRREAARPEGERDDTLIDECSENLLYCAFTIEELRREQAARASKRKAGNRSPRGFTLWPKNAFARAAVAAAAVVVFLAAGAAVSKALGFSPWAPHLSKENGIPKVDYSNHGPNEIPPIDARNTEGNGLVQPTAENPVSEKPAGIEHLVFSSFEELQLRYGDALFLPREEYGFEFENASADEVCDPETGLLRTGLLKCRFNYLASEILLTVNYFGAEIGDDNITVSRYLPEGAVQTKTVVISGIECLVAVGTEESAAYFHSGHNVYTVSCPSETDPMPIAELIISGR